MRIFLIGVLILCISRSAAFSLGKIQSRLWHCRASPVTSDKSMESIWLNCGRALVSLGLKSDISRQVNYIKTLVGQHQYVRVRISSDKISIHNFSKHLDDAGLSILMTKKREIMVSTSRSDKIENNSITDNVAS